MSLTKLDALVAGAAAIETLLRRPDEAKPLGPDDARSALAAGLRVLFDRTETREAERAASMLGELDRRLQEREAALVSFAEQLEAREAEMEHRLLGREIELHQIADRLTARELALLAVEQRLAAMEERLLGRDLALREIEVRRRADDAIEAARSERVGQCIRDAVARFYAIGLDLTRAFEPGPARAPSLSTADQAVLRAILRLGVADVPFARIRAWLQRGAWRRSVHRNPALQAVSEELLQYPHEDVKEAIGRHTEEPAWSRIIAPLEAHHARSQAQAQAQAPSTASDGPFASFLERARLLLEEDDDIDPASDDETPPLHVVGEEGK